MSIHQMINKLIRLTSFTLLLSGCPQQPSGGDGVTPQAMADAIHTVIESDRSAYAKFIINRLVFEEKVIKASEHWQDDKALLLPAQMFRAGAEIAAEKQDGFSYTLLSEWPINKQNAAKTDLEKEGLKNISETKSNFYGEEQFGEQLFFTAMYPDIAVAEACSQCHNKHDDSPKTDFKVGDVMGAIVIRIPLSS